jgi:hypothetical protein
VEQLREVEQARVRARADLATCEGEAVADEFGPARALRTIRETVRDWRA